MLSLKGIVLETVTTECRRITRKNVCQCNIQDRGFNSPENDTMKLSDKQNGMAMRLEPALNFLQISIGKYGFEVRIEKAQLKAA